MRKTLTAIAAAATLALASVATIQPAQARHGHNAAAIIGGLAAGALVGAAVANGPYYGGPGYYYGPPRPLLLSSALLVEPRALLEWLPLAFASRPRVRLSGRFSAS